MTNMTVHYGQFGKFDKYLTSDSIESGKYHPCVYAHRTFWILLDASVPSGVTSLCDPVSRSAVTTIDYDCRTKGIQNRNLHVDRIH